MEAWIESFTKYVEIGDRRLKARLGKIVETLIRKPKASIPEACNSNSEIMATYRFFKNEKVRADALRKGFCKATIENIKNEKRVLIATDLTGINFHSHKKLEGLGPMRNWQSKGLALATSMAIDMNGTPQGLIYQKLWGRSNTETGLNARLERKKLPEEERESYFWIEALKTMEKYLPENVCGIMVGDRGSDFYNLFATKRNGNIELLIRAKVNRRLHNDELKLFERMSHGEPDGKTLINVPRSKKGEARTAEVEIRFKKVGISAPIKKGNETSNPIFLYAVEAKEVNMKKNVSNPIHWNLLTTISINSLTEAIEKVLWYSKRWLIERYHYVLKSGCSVEELQLETVAGIERALAVYCTIAWQILFLTYEARNNPNMSCETYFSKEEWITCFKFLRLKVPEEAPTMQEFIKMIAKLGGFLGRKGDGDPGVKVIWRGLRTFNIVLDAFTAFKGKDVYNG